MFGGPRDSEWTHIRVVGDRAEAAKYLPFARVLLGAAKAAVKTGVIKLNVLSRRLNNGVTIRAEMAMGIPRIVITIPPNPLAQDSDVTLDGFITTPRDADNPNGIDAQFPQVVLSPPVKRQQRWTSFLYERFAGAWQRVTSAKEVYGKRGERNLLVEGLNNYGNRYWRGKDGVVLSWVGRDDRITGGAVPIVTDGVVSFSTSVIRPRTYSPYVFHFGRALIDVNDSRFGFGTGRPYVASACFRRTLTGVWVYVVQLNAINPLSFRIYRYPVVPGEERPGFRVPRIDYDADVPREAVGPGVVLPYNAVTLRGEDIVSCDFSPDGRRLLVHSELLLTSTVAEPTKIGYNGGYSAVREYDVDTGALLSEVLHRMYPNQPSQAPFCVGYSPTGVIRSIDIEQTAYNSVDYAERVVPGSYVLGDTRIPMGALDVSRGEVWSRAVMAVSPESQHMLTVRTDYSGDLYGNYSYTQVVELWGAGGLLRSYPPASASAFSNYGQHPYPEGVGGPPFARMVVVLTATTASPTTAPDGYSPHAWFAAAVRNGTVFNSILIAYGYNAHYGYIPYPDNATGVAYTTVGTQGTGVYPRGDAVANDYAPDALGRPRTVSLVWFEGYVAVSSYKPGAPGETLVDLVPDGDAESMTGLTGSSLRLHPISLLGAPMFKTE